MDALLRAGLVNALTATAVGLAVLALGRFCRRPALLHALWLLVLLKLITPPLWDVPVPRPTVTGAAAAVPHAPAEDTPVPPTPVSPEKPAAGAVPLTTT